MSVRARVRVCVCVCPRACVYSRPAAADRPRAQRTSRLPTVPNTMCTLLPPPCLRAEVSPTRIRSVEDALSVGEEVEVLCLGRDARGNIKVSRKALLAKQGAARREA